MKGARKLIVVLSIVLVMGGFVACGTTGASGQATGAQSGAVV